MSVENVDLIFKKAFDTINKLIEKSRDRLEKAKLTSDTELIQALEEELHRRELMKENLGYHYERGFRGMGVVKLLASKISREAQEKRR
jgi:hypothetical protein